MKGLGLELDNFDFGAIGEAFNYFISGFGENIVMGVFYCIADFFLGLFSWIPIP